MKKYPYITQHSEEDCGAACLATILKKYDRTLTMNQIRNVVGTGKQGTTLLGLKRGAEELGFYARSVQASPQIVDKLNQIHYIPIKRSESGKLNLYLLVPKIPFF